MPDFTQYQPPGVYVEEDLTALVSVVGVQPAVVAIVGPGQGFQLATETVNFSVSNTVALSHSVVDVNTVVVKGPGGAEYDLTDDYTVATDEDGITSITWVDNAEEGIPAGGVIYVSYQYTPVEYYEPFRVTDFDDVQAAYGPPVSLETGGIFSPISFAARLAFQNGSRELVLVATPGDAGPGSAPVSLEDLTTAYTKLLAEFDVDLIVPLPVGVTDGDAEAVGTDLAQHLQNAADDDLFRVGVLGYDTGITLAPNNLAQTISHQRVILAWPNILRYYHGYSNTTSDVAGYYLAAAYAGRMAGLPVQMPLTKKQVSGFAGLPANVLSSMTNTVKNAWSAAGVAVTEQTRDNRLEVRHGVTTNIANINTREISLVRAKDALVDLIRGTVEGAELIGTWIEEETPGRVKSVVAGALEAAVDNDIIVEYNDLKARQLNTDPSVIEVKFQYRPAYPLNYIVIKFSINTETGEVVTTEEEVLV